MATMEIEDAAGRLWSVGDPTIKRDERYDGIVRDGGVASRRVCVKTVITLHCLVDEGQEVPDADEVLRRGVKAVTLGGSRSRQVPEPASAAD